MTPAASGNEPLSAVDPKIAELVAAEERRERDVVRLIPSENYVSRAVLEATGTVFTNKYSEGYSGKRYYEGQQVVDPLEALAVERAKALFGSAHANVQPYSGSPANLAVYLAFLQPGDTFLSVELPHGGHLSHGSPVSFSGKWFHPVHYGVRADTGRLDYDQVRDLAKRERPKLIWAGGTAIPRIIDFEALAEIARDAGAVFAADIAHIAGLIAGEQHPTPVGLADVVTTTTHKTLRGPRGAMIMAAEQHATAIDKAIFPGLQGGPHNHTTAGIAVALHEAAQPAFKDYARRVVENAKALAQGLLDRGFDLVSGGTDNHLILIDLTNKNVTGKIAAKALDRAGIELNFNTVPFDPRKPFDPSGIRLGSPAVTSRGFEPEQMAHVAAWIDEVVSHVEDDALIARVAGEVRDLCAQFPPPGLG